MILIKRDNISILVAKYMIKLPTGFYISNWTVKKHNVKMKTRFASKEWNYKKGIKIAQNQLKGWAFE